MKYVIYAIEAIKNKIKANLNKQKKSSEDKLQTLEKY